MTQQDGKLYPFKNSLQSKSSIYLFLREALNNMPVL